VRGEKLVIFVTGICPRKCYFCPVSDEKYQKDVIFANERKVSDTCDLIKEAELMTARGAGITGGDPLCRMQRTVEYIKTLKERFGKEFHIHLYTSLNLVDEKKLQELYEAGLDEIRFHLDLDDKSLWKNVELARKHSWDVGVEIPLIPDQEERTRELIDFIEGKVGFLNLNELEVADNEHSDLLQKGFKTKDELSYAVRGSMEMGLRLVEYVKEKECPLAVHLCTAKLKDAVQLSKRIKREAKGVRKAFDIVDDEGMLLRGALYLPELVPGFGYRKKLMEVDKNSIILRLKPLSERIKKKFKLKEGDMFVDEEKPRILLAKKLVKKKRTYFLKLGLLPAVVKEYPTADQLEVEVELLK